MRLSRKIVFICALCAAVLGASAFHITSAIHGVTPHRTATTRRFGVGDDTITSVHLGMHNGQIVYAKIAHHGKMHQGKKNGGKTYHRHIDVHAEIPDHLDHVVFSAILVNMADPQHNALIQMAEQMTMGLMPAMQKHGKYIHLGVEGRGAESAGNDIIDDLSVHLPKLAFPFGHVDTNSLVNRLTRQFRNADGPVWFSSMLVENPRMVGAGHVWDGTKTEAGLTPPAVYEVIWKVTRL